MISISEHPTGPSHDIVLCIHNGLTDVTKCIDSLVRNYDAKSDGRIILVDDCSNQETRSYLEDVVRQNSLFCLISTGEQKYYTKAANIGLRASKAAIITLLNSDTIVTANWSERIMNVFAQSPHIGIVGPLSNAAGTQSLPFVKSSKGQTAINVLPPNVGIEEFAAGIAQMAVGTITPFVPLVHGFCLSIRRSVIEQIGYFDEECFPFGYGEENDYCLRAENDGFLLAVAVDTFVFHAKSKSYSSEERIQFMKNGMEQLVARHGAQRIKSAVSFMEENPHLDFMRQSVIERWPDCYSRQ